MKTKLATLFAALTLLSACAGSKPPQVLPRTSNEVLIAQEDNKIRAAIVEVVQNAPNMGFPAGLVLAGVSKGLTKLRNVSFASNVCYTASCPPPPVSVVKQEGGEGHSTADNSGNGTAKTDPVASTDGSVLNDAPRPPVDQRKAPISLPGPVQAE